MLSENDRTYLPGEIPGKEIHETFSGDRSTTKPRPRMNFGAIFDDENGRPSGALCERCTTELDKADSAILDLRIDLSCLEANTDRSFSDHNDRINSSETEIAALQFNVETLESAVRTLEDILGDSDKKVIRITTRRYQVSEFMRFIGMTALGFTAVLFVGSALSGDRLQKDEYAQTAVVTGLAAVTAISIGFNLQD